MATGISSTPLSLSYTYSGNGNIVKITDNTGANPVELNYTYDAKGQLKTAQVNKPTGIETVPYSYDGTSNRISETWKNNQNQILSQYTYTYQPGDYLISKTDPSSVVNYTWDIYGQLSSKSTGENYIFTGKRNLNSVTESNTVTELYTYDALGRRLKVQNADTTTLNFPLGNDTSYEVKKEGADTTVTKYISANGKYLAKTVKLNTNPEQKYFHHIDLVGSIRAITDATGTVTASYEYEPFGVTVKTTGSYQDNLGFAGKRLDAGSGLSYFGARYYDSEMGRFISRDPVKDGRNWYVYCYNNPLSYVDPNGLLSLQLAAPIVLGIVPTLANVGVKITDVLITTGSVLLNMGSEAVSFLSNGLVEFAHTVGDVAQGFADKMFGNSSNIDPGDWDPKNWKWQPDKWKNAKVKLTDKKDIKYLEKRNWTLEKVQEVVNNPYAHAQAMNKANGKLATAFFDRMGNYVVVEHETFNLVQVSKIGDAGWILDETIIYDTIETIYSIFLK